MTEPTTPAAPSGTVRADVRLCICCHKTPVTWPLVCDDCADHEAQDTLANEGYDTCRSCGIYYDGGTRCTYCGDGNPTDDPEIQDEIDRDEL